MLHYSRVIQGISNFIDAELVGKLAGSWKAWALGGMGNGCGTTWNHTGCGCSENQMVNRYELAQESRIADLQSQIALRDANTYNDQKLLEVYKYFDGKIEGINSRLCDQAVWNATQTATIGCMAQQIAALNSLTKLVVPNTSVCPGWGNVTITPATTTAG